jgi:glycosyltransferase involved in cell wall biosynthesis
MLVSIIIPAYKQEKTIKEDIENIYDVMSRTRWPFELIVVDDGSPDNTYKEAKKLETDDIRVVGYKNNKGKGYAVRYGMARAVGDIISFIDAGRDIDANDISMLLEHMQWYDADIVVGSKRHLVSKVDYPFIRKVYSWVYYTLVRILFGLKIRDTQTGLKAYKREVLETVMPRLLVKQFAFDIELLAVARRLGYARIYEAPVRIKMDTSKSNFSGRVIFDKKIRKMVLNTLAVFYRLHILSYYDDDNTREWTYDKDLDMKINTGRSG